MLEDAGFEDVQFSEQRHDNFSDAPFASSAASFGAKGVDIRAVRPGG